MISDFLIIPTPQGYEYRLAESVTGNPDATEWTVALRANANWSDGTPVTSADVVYTWHIHANETLAISPSSWDDVVGVDEWRAGTADSISGIVALDPKTVVFRLKSSNGAFPAILADFVNFVIKDGMAGSPAELKAMSSEEFNRLEVWQHPPSNGPLTIVETVPGEYAELAPNPGWYGSQVAWERVIGRVVDMKVAAAQLQAGDLDWSIVPLGEIKRLAELGLGTAVVEAPYPYVGEVNLITGRLADKRARQAVAYACDSATFTESYFGGSVEFIPTYIQAEWVSRDGLNMYEYNPTRAKQLLDEAGFDYSLPIRWLQFNPNDVNLNAYIDTCQAQLEDIGVSVERVGGVDNVTPLLEAGEFELYSHGGSFSQHDPDLLSPLLTCAGIPGGTATDTYQFVTNRANYCNPEFDALFAAARATSDIDERARLYYDASLIINEDLPYLIHMPITFNMAWDSSISPETANPMWSFIDRWAPVP